MTDWKRVHATRVTAATKDADDDTRWKMVEDITRIGELKFGDVIKTFTGAFGVRIYCPRRYEK